MISSHKPGFCLGWYSDVYTSDQCRVCHNKNELTRLSAPPPKQDCFNTRITGIKISAIENFREPESIGWDSGAIELPCIHLGDIIEFANPGCNKHIYDCDIHERCRLYEWDTNINLICCKRCPTYDDGLSTPTIGVVIGSYNLPKLIEIQVALIHTRCGPEVPILIVDDCSDGYGHTPGPDTVCGQLRKIAATYPNVTLFIHPMRMGHASGDLSKVWMGIQWAAARNIKYLAALSQRFVIDVPSWVMKGAKELQRTNLPVASQPCIEGNGRFPIRSEAMMLDVEKWNKPAILDHLMPRRLTSIPGEWGVAAEYVYWDNVKDRLGGKAHKWSLFGPDRGIQYPGIIWHCSHQEIHYKQLANRLKLPLDDNFSCNGWRFLQDQGYQG